MLPTPLCGIFIFGLSFIFEVVKSFAFVFPFFFGVALIFRVNSIFGVSSRVVFNLLTSDGALTLSLGQASNLLL